MASAGRIVALVVFTFMLSQAAVAQTFFTECADPSNSAAVVVIDDNAHLSVGGATLRKGDEIAAYTEDGICAGAHVWNGEQGAFTIWGDDFMSPEKDGLEEDEEIQFRVWQRSSNTVIGADGTLAVSFGDDEEFYATDGRFADGGIYQVASLEDALPPSAPGLLAPANDARDRERAIELAWSRGTSAHTYEIVVSTRSNLSRPLVSETVTDTVFALAELEHLTTYFWRVRALGDHGKSPWSSTFRFRTAPRAEPIALDTPQLLAPADGATNQPFMMGIMWFEVPGATSYRLQLDVSPDFSNPTFDLANLTEFWYVVPDVPAGTRYYWRVQAASDKGQSAWTLPYSFTTMAPLAFDPAGIPMMPPPAGAAVYAEETVVFWHSGPTRDRNEVVVPGDLDLEGALRMAESERALTDCTSRSEECAGSRRPSSGEDRARQMTELRSDALARLLDGRHSTATDEPVEKRHLAWAEVPDASHYRLEISTRVDFSDVVHRAQELTATVYEIPDIEEGEYFWRVKAVGEEEESNWSSAYTVQVEARSDEPTEIRPAGFALDQNYPNPFSGSTNVAFEIPESGYVEIRVYDALGAEVATLVSGTLDAGRHRVTWNADRLSSGMYLIHIRAGASTSTKRATLIR